MHLIYNQNKISQSLYTQNKKIANFKLDCFFFIKCQQLHNYLMHQFGSNCPMLSFEPWIKVDASKLSKERELFRRLFPSDATKRKPKQSTCLIGLHNRTLRESWLLKLDGKKKFDMRIESLTTCHR